MFKRKIIQKRVIALILAMVLLAAIPILTASVVIAEEEVCPPHNIVTTYYGPQKRCYLAECTMCDFKHLSHEMGSGPFYDEWGFARCRGCNTLFPPGK